MGKTFFNLGWGFIALTSSFLFVITAFYFSFQHDYNFLLEKQDLVHNPIWRTAFYIHITGGMLSILIGPFQFLKTLRKKRLDIHRKLGKTYLASILFVAGPSGLFMAFYAEGGPISSLGFAIMALLWMLFTFRAYETVRMGDIQGHVQWITRSFALTFAAVTLRFYVPVASGILNFETDFTIISSAWFSWIPNLIVAELLIRYKKLQNPKIHPS